MVIAHKKTNRFLTILLIISMTLTMLPLMSFADEVKSKEISYSVKNQINESFEVSTTELPGYYWDGDICEMPIYVVKVSDSTTSLIVTDSTKLMYQIADCNWDHNKKFNDGTAETEELKFYYPKNNGSSLNELYSIDGTNCTMLEGIVDYKKYEISSLLIMSDEETEDAILLVQHGGGVGTGGDIVDKSTLQTAISSAESLNVEDYYNENDRYNGKQEDTITIEGGSFWEKFQIELEKAKELNTDESASQDKVDEMVENLNNVIEKLIPKTQVNATEIYEIINANWYYSGNDIIQKPDDYLGEELPIKEEYTSEYTWKKYQEVRDSAQDMINSLYMADGQPTEINKGEYQEEVESMKQELLEALENCDPVDESNQEGQLVDAKLAYDGIGILLNKLFNPETLTQSKYTEESWSNFILAREKALEKYNSQPLPVERIGKKESASYIKEYMDLSDACYGLVPESGDVNVSLDIVDSYAAKKNVTEHDYAGSYDLTLSAGSSLDDAFKAALGEDYDLLNDRKDEKGIIFTINGCVLYNANTSHAENGGDGVIAPSNYSQIKLNDGDQLVLTRLQFPMKALVSSSVWYPIMDSTSEYKDIFIEQNGEKISEVEVEAGKNFNLTAKSKLSLVPCYNSRNSAFSNASVFISDCFASKEEAKKSAAIKDVDVRTDDEGQFSYGFYAEGWYLLNVFDFTDDIGSLSTGRNLIIHVTESSDLGKVRDELKEKLEEVYNKYEEEFYSKEDWEKICELYDSGISNIDSATTCAQMGETFENTSKSLESIQDKIYLELEKNLHFTRLYLKSLPNIEELEQGKLYSTDKIFMDRLFSEEVTYIIHYNGEFVENSAHYKKLTDYGKKQLTGKEAILLEALEKAYNESEQCTNLPESNYKVTVSLKDTNTKENIDLSKYNLELSYESVINKGEYINFEQGESIAPGYKIVVGLRGKEENSFKLGSCDYDFREDLLISVSSIKNGDKNGWIRYYMPRKDTEIAFYISAEGELIGTDDAIEDLTNEFNKYDKSDYDDENWRTLTVAYNEGIEAIRGAESATEVNEAKEAAIAAMVAVMKKQQDEPSDIPSWGDDNVFDSGKMVGAVDIIIENRTFKGGDFYGNIVKKISYPLGKKDSMMTCVLRALKDEGFTWNGTGGDASDDYKISYLASILKDGDKLGEFSGEAGSGWMATLNDWFVNEGLSEFTVKNGKLESGDIIKVMFTQNLGEDLGGTWGNSDTSLKKLSISSGKLTPSFKSDVYEYVLTIDGDTQSLVVEPTAANKNYLVKTFLNKKVTTNKDGNSFYKRTESIPASSGDIIYIGIGENAWPSMNNQGAEARKYSPTWYEIKVIGASGYDSVINWIDNLPATKKIIFDTYKDYKGNVDTIRAAYNALSTEDKAKVTNLSVLVEVEAKIKLYDDIDKVKELLDKIPSAAKIKISDKSTVIAADTAYKALSKEQQMYITIGDVSNYNEALEKLKQMGAFSGGSTPSKIKGSDEVPEEVIEEKNIELRPNAVVKGKVATATVSSEEADKAIDSLKKQKLDNLLIEPNIKGDVDKVVVKLPKTSIESLTKQKLDAGVVIKSDVGEINIPDKALKNIVNEQGKTIVITVERQDNSKLSDENKKLVGNYPVYALSIDVDGKVVKNFSNNLKVKLPYLAKDNVNTGKLTVYYIDDNGKATEMDGAYYDTKEKCLIFTTNHFSNFAIVFDESKIAFNDVKLGDWYYNSVQFVIKQKLFNGISETTFGAKNKMTRAMLVTVLYRMSGNPQVESESKFKDVKNEKWYTNPILWASSNDIVSGYSDVKFGTNDSITREQIAVILYRYAKLKGYDLSASSNIDKFKDKSSVSVYAYDAMNWAVANNIISGRTENTLESKGTATRAEVATMLMRFLEKFDK